MNYDLNKINQLLADKVMGWIEKVGFEIVNKKRIFVEIYIDEKDIKMMYTGHWNPTTDISQAKMVQAKIIEKITKEYEFWIQYDEYDKKSYYVFIFNKVNGETIHESSAKTESLAICLCALKLWGIEEKKYLKD